MAIIRWSIALSILTGIAYYVATVRSEETKKVRLDAVIKSALFDG